MKSFSRAASGMIILIGSLVILGWIFDIPVLKSILPQLASMKANTAMGFVLAGLALWLMLKEPVTLLQQRVSRVCALVVTLLGLLTLGEYLFGWELGIDQWLFKDLGGGMTNLTPGRMSPTTAVNFLFLGMALLFLDQKTSLSDRLAHSLGLLIMLLSGLALSGYLYGATALYGIGAYNQIAVHTASTFIIAAAGLLLAYPDRGVMAIITGGNAGSFMVRRLLPTAIILPVILGWLFLQGQRAGFYDSALSLALIVSASIVVFVSLLARNARLLNQTDAELKMAQASDLRQSEERLRYITWATRDAVWDRNLLTGEIWWNESLQKLLHYRAEDIESNISWWEQHIHPEDKDKVIRSIQNILETKQHLWSKEYRFQRADGSYANIFDRSYILYDEKTSQPQRMIGSMADITEQKQVEQALRQSEELFAKAFSASPAGIILTRKVDGLVIEVNDAYLKMVEYKRSEVLGKTTLELGVIRPEDRDRLMQLFKDRGAVRDFETWMGTKSGGLKAVFSSLEQLELAGETCLLSIVYDITARKRTEAALQQSEEKWRRLFEILPVGVSVINELKNVVEMNPALQKILQISVDGLSSGDYQQRQYLHADNTPVAPDEFPSFLAVEKQQIVQDVEICVVKEDGERIWTNVSAAPLPFEDIRAVIVTTDITARKRVEEALAQEQYLLNTLLENAPDHIYFKDAESRFLRISAAHARLFGLNDPAQVIGKTDFDFFTEEHARPAYDDEREIIRTGEPITKEERETWPDRPDTWVIATKMPLRNRRGEIVGTFGISKDITQRKQVEEALYNTNENLKNGLAELDQRNREIMLLTELGNLLQTCQTPDEAYALISVSVPKIFPGATGALYIIKASRNIVEAVATWKTLSPEERTFAPDDCLALRRGRPYLIGEHGSGLQCKHIVGEPASSICIPMMAQGEALGMFHLQVEHNEARKAPYTFEQGLAETVADTISLALTNLKLRETLRNQSIRDPLTDLFNRRFMEESLDREIHRATRNQRSLGIIMLDIDHFKKFNDTFGHEAGDTVLRDLGNFLKNNIRGGDIPCRYGGEEFILLLPEASLEATRRRAQKLCDDARELQIQHRGEMLGPLTLSLGVAVFPQHGQQAEDVVRAADSALYRAKQEGRNRVMVADT